MAETRNVSTEKVLILQHSSTGPVFFQSLSSTSERENELIVIFSCCLCLFSSALFNRFDL